MSTPNDSEVAQEDEPVEKDSVTRTRGPSAYADPPTPVAQPASTPAPALPPLPDRPISEPPIDLEPEFIPTKKNTTKRSSGYMKELNKQWSKEINKMSEEKKDWFLGLRHRQWLSSFRDALQGNTDEASEEAFISQQANLLNTLTPSASDGDLSLDSRQSSGRNSPVLETKDPAELGQPPAPDPNGPVTLTPAEKARIAKYLESRRKVAVGLIAQLSPPATAQKNRSKHASSKLPRKPAAVEDAKDDDAVAATGRPGTHEKKRSKSIWAKLFSREPVILSPMDLLVNYADKLRAQLDQHEQRIMLLQSERKKYRHEMPAEISKYRAYAIDSLVEVATKLYSDRLLMLSALLDIEWHYLDVLTRAVNEVQMCVDSGDVERVDPVFCDGDGYRAPEELERALASDDIDRKIRYCHQLSTNIAQSETNYKEMKKRALRVTSTKDRSRQLLTIMRRAMQSQMEELQSIASNFHYTPKDERQMRNFKAFMLDQRHKDGQILSKWRTLLHESGPKDVTAKAISTFFKLFSADRIKEYRLPHEMETQEELNSLYDTFTLALQRLMMPRIKRVLGNIQTKREADADAHLQRQSWWLCQLTQAQCGIPEDLCAADPRFNHGSDDSLPIPFHSAIQSLSHLEGEVVPKDMLYHILQCVRHLHRQAASYVQKNKNLTEDDPVEITADDMFPVVVWCVIQSRVRHLNTYLGMVERFVSEDIKHFGEIGMSLSLVEAAVVHIAELKIEAFFPTTESLPFVKMDPNTEPEVFLAPPKHGGSRFTMAPPPPAGPPPESALKVEVAPLPPELPPPTIQ